MHPIRASKLALGSTSPTSDRIAVTPTGVLRYPSRRTLPCWPGRRMRGPSTSGDAGGGVVGLCKAECTGAIGWTNAAASSLGRATSIVARNRRQGATCWLLVVSVATSLAAGPGVRAPRPLPLRWVLDAPDRAAYGSYQ